MEKLYFLSFSHVFRDSLIDNTQNHAVELLLTWLTHYPGVLNRNGQPYAINDDFVKDLEKKKQDVPKPIKIAVQRNPQITGDARIQFEEFLTSEISPLKEADLYYQLWKLIAATDIAPDLVADWEREYNAHEFDRFLADAFLYAVVQDAPTQRGKKKENAEKTTADAVVRDIEHLNSMLKELAYLEPIKKPDEIAPKEHAYISEVLLAYGSHLNNTYHSKSELPEDMQNDLEDRRDDFYAAETVRIQGSSALGASDEAEFGVLKEEIYSNVRGAYMAARNDDGFDRMVKVMERADTVTCVKSVFARTNWVGSGERRGVCHMLAGEKRLPWVVPDD